MTAVAVTPRSFRQTQGEHLELLAHSGLEARFPEHDRPLSEAEMIEFVRGCDALIVGVDPVTEAVLAAGPLRAVAKYGSGLDNIDVRAAERLGVGLASTPAANARSVAELALALLLGLARHVAYHDRAIRAGSWSRRTGLELAGRRLGIVGYGAVGREMAALSRALGMEVVVNDPDVDDPGLETASLDELLRSCDAVSLHVPLNDTTRGFIGAPELALMRPGAFLVNTARGGIVDEDALAEALAAGRLGGAAFDVFAEEPSGGSALLELDDFVASPHAGAATVAAIERAGVAAVRAVLHGLGVEAGAGER